MSHSFSDLLKFQQVQLLRWNWNKTKIIVVLHPTWQQSVFKMRHSAASSDNAGDDHHPCPWQISAMPWFPFDFTVCSTSSFRITTNCTYQQMTTRDKLQCASLALANPQLFSDVVKTFLIRHNDRHGGPRGLNFVVLDLSRPDLGSGLGLECMAQSWPKLKKWRSSLLSSWSCVGL